MRYRKTILVGVGIAGVLVLTYAGVSIARSFNRVEELGWGGFVSFDIPAEPLLFALAFGLAFVLLFRAPGNPN
jgi:hypothetical protein